VAEVRNLPRYAFFGCDCCDAVHGTSEGRRNSRLHSNLDRFEGAQPNIGDEFRGSRTGQEDQSLVLGSSFLTSKLAVEVLEVFVEAIFACSLYRVTHESWTPASEDAAEPFSSTDLTPGFEVALVHVGVDLATTFDEIEGSDGRVSGALLR
jgi:hypothetical protein